MSPPPVKPPVRPLPRKPGAKPEKPPPPPTPMEQLEKLAKSGYVDINDIGIFIGDIKANKPDRALLRELRNFAIKHQGVFDRGAFHKLKTFCDTYRSENDVD